ncbi:uncharacterized protein LOC121757269 isoform X2 [Salvia splendens]|uniref:uncharacterized protein LOC121757269 isoform X2 n=1 Tax=Salvia splendens TaxID=180675 RepID=UPI001C268AF7|nr:uncharacterized protein LOC121757269 isoform X2 [Salvia splendens]
MDAKALAKSKRAHSLHHKKKHHSQQGLKASSPSAGSDFKQASERPAKSEGQQAKERTSQFQSSREIPSNWNRYGDADFGLASENAREISSQLTEFVMPKSKDFMQDFGSMLAAKGQSMLSWIADDSFEFEGNASITPQAPFLSLNLDALAEQLAKQSCRRGYIYNQTFYPWICWTRHVAKTNKLLKLLHRLHPSVTIIQ